MKSPTVNSTLPKLYTAHGNIAKKWFVHFHYFNPNTGKNERVRIFTGFASHNTYQEKLQHGYRLVNELSQKLKSGWNPFGASVPENAIVPNAPHIPFDRGKEIRTVLTELVEQLRRERQWREKTYDDYSSQVRIFCAYIQKQKKHLSIRGINETEAGRFLEWITTEKKASPTTRNKYRAVMRGLWHQLLRKGIAQQNPWREVPKVKEHREGKLAFSKTQAQKLKEEMQKSDLWLWLVCSFQFHCFLRPVSEVRMLQVQDIDFDTRKVRIKGKHVKTHRSKIKDLPTALFEELKAMGIDKLRPDFYIFGKNGVPGSEPISRNRFYKRHAKIQKRFGIGQEYSLYSWKHTGNVMLYRKFKDLKMNQAINDHTDISTTDIYLRSKGAYDIEAVRNAFPTL